MARRWANNLDMYRKVPTDLLEGTKRGSILSYMSVFVMVTLFLLETRAFLSSSTVTDLALDSNPDQMIRLNFNITMLDLKCDFAVVDVVSSMGENQNVTAHITKWNVDGDGIRQRFRGRNTKQDDLIALKDELVEETIEELHENGEDAISLERNTLQFARRENKYLFVDFYASWCSHCKDLAPTWETFAEIMMDAADLVVSETDERYHSEDYSDEEYEAAIKLAKPVFIGKVDCVDHLDLCREQQIRAYPTLRMFVDGKFVQDYQGHRTVLQLTKFVQDIETKYTENDNEKKLDNIHEHAHDRMGTVDTSGLPDDASEEEKDWARNIERQKKQRHGRNSRQKGNDVIDDWKDEDHPGCQLFGYLMLDRVPGNFHIQARSSSHDIAPHMTNVSHIIHSLSFGEPIVQRELQRNELGNVPRHVVSKIAPMNENVYVSHRLHEGFTHYLKVVTTNLSDNMGFGYQGRIKRAYQILQNSQLAYYRNDIVPEAKFMYDLSPISVSYRESGRYWYDYLTSLMAIIGGTFTVVGMLEGSIRAVSSSRKKF
mmetsp:Transcript_25192/g.35500  ORF Transcript_25192/g.35500 Transcript_25192/m.35500 type:complete len:543 (-) Transcript_25192:181-1809(-)